MHHQITRVHHCPCPLITSTSPHSAATLSRRLSTPDTLQEAIALRQSVQTVVALGPAAHEAAESVDLVLAGVAALLVDFADADLHRGVIFGFDDAVCGRALAGDVAVEIERLVWEAVGRMVKWLVCRLRRAVVDCMIWDCGGLQIDDLAFLVLHGG